MERKWRERESERERGCVCAVCVWEKANFSRSTNHAKRGSEAPPPKRAKRFIGNQPDVPNRLPRNLMPLLPERLLDRVLDARREAARLVRGLVQDEREVPEEGGVVPDARVALGRHRCWMLSCLASLCVRVACVACVASGQDWQMEAWALQRRALFDNKKKHVAEESCCLWFAAGTLLVICSWHAACRLQLAHDAFSPTTKPLLREAA